MAQRGDVNDVESPRFNKLLFDIASYERKFRRIRGMEWCVVKGRARKWTKAKRVESSRNELNLGIELKRDT